MAPDDRGRVDADREVLGDVAEALVVVGRGHDPGPGVVGDAVGGQVLVGAGHAVPGDGHEDDLRVDLPEVVVAEAAAGQGPGTHRLHHRISGAGQLAEDLDALGRAQVDGDAALAPVGVQEEQRGALDDRPGHLAPVVTGRRLDLDDLGAEVDERLGDGGGTEDRGLEDPHAGEGARGRHAHKSDTPSDPRAPSRGVPRRPCLAAVPQGAQMGHDGRPARGPDRRGDPSCES